MKWFYGIRSILFYILLALWTVVCCSLIFLPLGSRRRCQVYIARPYAHGVCHLCHIICGVQWNIEGKNNISAIPCVIASNHQSAWETFFLQYLFAPQATILRKNLLNIPFFGWGLRRCRPIAIGRSNPYSDMHHISIDGCAALKEKFWVVIFPEGTRTTWPNIKHYSRSATALALKAHLPILPIVHNAGCFWPKNTWIKRPWYHYFTHWTHHSNYSTHTTSHPKRTRTMDGRSPTPITYLTIYNHHLLPRFTGATMVFFSSTSTAFTTLTFFSVFAHYTVTILTIFFIFARRTAHLLSLHYCVFISFIRQYGWRMLFMRRRRRMATMVRNKQRSFLSTPYKKYTQYR